jgi:protoheme IX farnesyltransferase
LKATLLPEAVLSEPSATPVPQAGMPDRALQKLSAYMELTKPRITFLILMVASAGFWLGSTGTPDGILLLNLIAGLGLLSGGIFALNQYLERDLDALMRRTGNRPLPTGRLTPSEARWFGVALSALAIGALTWGVNAASGVLAFVTLSWYLFLYTPLKRRTPHCTLVGAFPGAVPPLAGWVAARGAPSIEGWALFAILFLWQFPHFHSIAWLYRDDYARADILLWPVVEPDGKITSRQIVACTALLVPVSLLPTLLGLSGRFYFCGAAILGFAFLFLGAKAAQRKSRIEAQRLLMASVVYLPVLFLLMVLNKA